MTRFTCDKIKLSEALNNVSKAVSDRSAYMKLYFGESGIDMHRMFLRYVGKNDIESFRNE